MISPSPGAGGAERDVGAACAGRGGGGPPVLAGHGQARHHRAVAAGVRQGVVPGLGEGSRDDVILRGGDVTGTLGEAGAAHAGGAGRDGLGGGAALHQTPHLRAVGVGALVRAGAALRHGDGGELAGWTELRHAGHVVTLSNAQLCAISNTLLTCWCGQRAGSGQQEPGGVGARSPLGQRPGPGPHSTSSQPLGGRQKVRAIVFLLIDNAHNV